MKYLYIFLLNGLIVSISILLSKLSLLMDSKIVGQNNVTSTFGILIGIGLVVLGLTIRVIASLQFYSHSVRVLTLNVQNILITTGVYQFSHNPLYLGIVLIFLGNILVSGSVFGIFLWLTSLSFCHYWISEKEERQLSDKFGSQYRKYKKAFGSIHKIAR